MVDSGGHDDPAYALLFSERLDRSTCGLTGYDVSPTHAEGRQFDPGQVHTRTAD